jgi:hypothetical protein
MVTFGSDNINFYNKKIDVFDANKCVYNIIQYHTISYNIIQMDLLVDNQVEFISQLLTRYDVNTIQHTLKNSMIVITDVTNLGHNLDKLYFAIMAGLYGDAIKIILQCRNQFDAYKNNINHHIKFLYDRYQAIVETIRKKILDEFNCTTSTNPDQMSQIYDLLDLLDDDNKDKFLSELANKICSQSFPVGAFVDNYKLQLNVIMLINDTKYSKLSRWNFSSYVVNAWSALLRSNIIKESITKLNMSIFDYSRKAESTYIKYGGHEEIILIAFDKFVNYRMDKIILEYRMPSISLDVDKDTFTFASTFIGSLLVLDKTVSELVTKRNMTTLIKFYEVTFAEMLQLIKKFFFDNKSEILKESYLVPIQQMFKFIASNISSLHTKYPDMLIKDIKLERVKKDIYTLYFDHYKLICIKLVNESISRFTTNILQQMIKPKKTTDTIVDTSSEVEKICSMIDHAATLDKTIEIYLLNVVSDEYKNNIFSDLFTKLNTDAYCQLLLDLSQIKSHYKEHSSVFVDLENKIKLLSGDIYNEQTFVDQFKTMYRFHSVDALRKVLKNKNISSAISARIVKLYAAKNA